MIATFGKALRPLEGALNVPGDKSLSHRALLFAAMAEGSSNLSGVLDSADVRATATAVEELGARLAFGEPDETGLSVRVTGWGSHGPRQPDWVIQCHNSGTTARLLMGVLAGWPVKVTLTGDASLSRRPMRRITEPLSRMGVSFDEDPRGTLPITMTGNERLAPIAYPSPVASAQLKSAVLLAGLRAHGRTRVTEPTLSRDHTERLLPAFGVQVLRDDAPGVSIDGPARMTSTDFHVPGDPSSAAFLAVAALLIPGSDLELPGVSLNPTRLGFLHVLERMGGIVEMVGEQQTEVEPIGAIRAEYSPVLLATNISEAEVPALVDEIPILALAATQASGTSRFEGVGELRVKESDRLSAIAEGLTAFGASVRTGHDWIEIDGPCRLRGAEVDSLGDHRLAMTYAIAALIAEGPTRIERFDAVDVSFPNFGAMVGPLLADESA